MNATLSSFVTLLPATLFGLGRLLGRLLLLLVLALAFIPRNRLLEYLQDLFIRNLLVTLVFTEVECRWGPKFRNTILSKGCYTLVSTQNAYNGFCHYRS